jgi:hypothetical protein
MTAQRRATDARQTNERLRSASKAAQRAHQQRQTHWRRLIGGPSAGGTFAVAQVSVERGLTARSTTNESKAIVGALDFCGRFVGSAETRSQQHRRFGLEGTRPVSQCPAGCWCWQHGRWQQARTGFADAGSCLSVTQHHPVGKTMPTVERSVTSLKRKCFIGGCCVTCPTLQEYATGVG